MPAPQPSHRVLGLWRHLAETAAQIATSMGKEDNAKCARDRAPLQRRSIAGRSRRVVAGAPYARASF